MRSSLTLLGHYQPGTSPWHRVSVGWKYLIAMVLIIPAVILGQPGWTWAAVAITATLLLTTGLPPLKTLALPWQLILLLAAVAAFQWVTGQPDAALVVPGGIVLAVLATRLVLVTTRTADLIDALVSAVGWIPGVDGERFGLAVGLMLRSIPFLLDGFGEVRDAARARGLERHWLARLAPVVVRAVGYAQATGEALAARGLGERGSAPKLSR